MVTVLKWSSRSIALASRCTTNCTYSLGIHAGVPGLGWQKTTTFSCHGWSCACLNKAAIPRRDVLFRKRRETLSPWCFGMNDAIPSVSGQPLRSCRFVSMFMGGSYLGSTIFYFIIVSKTGLTTIAARDWPMVGFVLFDPNQSCPKSPKNMTNEYYLPKTGFLLVKWLEERIFNSILSLLRVFPIQLASSPLNVDL